ADLSYNFFRVVFHLPQRFHAIAELLLNPYVGPPLPVGDVAELLYLRRQRRLRRLQALQDLVVVALGGQRWHVGERRADLAERMLAGFQREIGPGRGELDARQRVIQPAERLAARPRVALLG